ncbi:MAG: hypothetical protein ACI3WQ_01650 [Faecousia sp.]
MADEAAECGANSPDRQKNIIKRRKKYGNQERWRIRCHKVLAAGCFFVSAAGCKTRSAAAGS